MIRVIEGDLLEVSVDIIAHQVNCLGIMGGGIAKQIKAKYPEVYLRYNRLCKEKEPSELMGKYQILKRDNGYVANLFGQVRIGITTRQTDYNALRNALIGLKDFAKVRDLTIGIPYRIGCGLAGGDWDIVREIIDEVFVDYDITIYKL